MRSSFARSRLPLWMAGGLLFFAAHAHAQTLGVSVGTSSVESGGVCFAPLDSPLSAAQVEVETGVGDGGAKVAGAVTVNGAGRDWPPPPPDTDFRPGSLRFGGGEPAPGDVALSSGIAVSLVGRLGFEFPIGDRFGGRPFVGLGASYLAEGDFDIDAPDGAEVLVLQSSLDPEVQIGAVLTYPLSDRIGLRLEAATEFIFVGTQEAVDGNDRVFELDAGTLTQFHALVGLAVALGGRDRQGGR